MNYQKIAIKKIMEDQSLPLLTKLNSNNFNKSYKTIFKMIEAYYDKYNKIPTIDVLKAYADSNFKKEKAEVVNSILTSLNRIEENLTDEEIVEAIKKDTIIRNIDSVSEEFIDALQEKDIDKLLTLTEQIQNSVIQINNTLPEDITQTEFKKIGLASVPCYLPTFQREGIDLTGLTIVGGFSGSGKSLFSLQQALYSYEQGHKVGILSLELPIPMLMTRMYSLVNDVEYREVLHNVSKEEIENWKKSYFRPNSFFVKDIRYNTTEIKKAVNYMVKQGVKVIVIDYLNLVEANSNQEEWKQMANLVKDLHALSVEHNIVIISPSQLNINVDKKGNIEATTRGSKELEYSSSVMLLIYQSKEEYEEGVARVIVKKARSAKKITLMTKTEFSKMKFVDLGITV